jgi:hypothetical protein
VFDSGEEFQTNLHLILSSDIMLLLVQVLESNLLLVSVGEEVWSGANSERHHQSLLGC